MIEYNYKNIVESDHMRTVDLFCGCGGLSLGFQKAGFEIVGAFDLWQPAIDCYSLNFEHQAIVLDISKKNTALKVIRPLQPEIIIGGPPCQDFSSAGGRQEGDRASLTISFAKIVKAIRPKYFVMENVSRAKLSAAYADARMLLKDAGYGLSEQVLDASKCGVPQKRKRFFCVGALNEAEGFLNKYLASNQSVLPMSVRNYFFACGYTLDFEHYYRHPRTYSRRAIYSVDEPSATIRGSNRPRPAEYCPHINDSAQPENINSLTTKQRSLLQTFPSTFLLPDNQSIAEQLLGNAVPVNLSNHVAQAILAFDRKDNYRQSIEFADWIQQKHHFTPAAAHDIVSRLGRCNRLVFLKEQPLEEYLELLNNNQEFKTIKKTVRSQLRRAVSLYFEYKECPHL